jgi:hypothetical protein
MADPSLPKDRFTPGDFRVGRVLSRAWSVFWHNVLKFSLFTGIAVLPSLLIHPAASNPFASPQLILSELPLVFLLNLLAQAIVFYGGFQEMRGRSVKLGDALKVSFGRFFPLIGLGLIVILVVFGLAVIGALLLFAVAGTDATALIMFPFVVLLTIPSTMLFLMWSMATPVCVVERASPFRSLGRSRELTKGHRRKILSLLFLAAIPNGIAGRIVDGISDAIVSLAPASGFGIAVTQTISLIWNAMWLAFLAVIFVVTYHDLRVAKEGVDTDQIAAVFE